VAAAAPTFMADTYNVTWRDVPKLTRARTCIDRTLQVIDIDRRLNVAGFFVLKETFKILLLYEGRHKMAST
jgi:hypothetical protein